MTNSEHTAEKDDKDKRGTGLGLNNLLLISNYVLFGFSMLAVVASILVFFVARAYDREKDRELEHYKAQAQAEVARSHEAAELAKADAAVARAEAEKARLATAEISERLSGTQQALRDSREPRSLTRSQRTKLLKGLKDFRPVGSMFFVTATSDTGARAYASEFLDLANKAGVPTLSKVELGQFVESKTHTEEVIITHGTNVRGEDWKKLAAIMKAAGIPFEIQATTKAEEELMPGSATYLTIAVIGKRTQF